MPQTKIKLKILKIIFLILKKNWKVEEASNDFLKETHYVFLDKIEKY
jgi:hypothetical protein